ncbi:methionine aminopeptidase [uncultured bacterium]|nr:methionine aminopeptidase [uncultured bacterium]
MFLNINPDIIEGGNLLSFFLKKVDNLVTVGNTGKNIDKFIQQLFQKYNCKSAPIIEYDFPGNSCISINDCMCHGIPNDYKFQHGDVVSIDISFKYKDNFFDAGRTYIVLDPNMNITFKIKSLIELNGFNICANLETIRILNQIYYQNNICGKKTDYSIIGNIFQSIISNLKYSVSYEYGGHKIGEKLHLTPFISSVRGNNTNKFIQDGDMFCFEPLLSFRTCKSDRIISYTNGWEVFNKSKEAVVHYENTYIVNDGYIYSISG